MGVPLLDVNAQNLPLEAEFRAAFDRVFRSGQFILGTEVLEFEAEVAAHCGVKHAIGVSSGTDAILLALMTLGIGAGDEVITPSFTFFATAGCVARVGAKPVFVDSLPDSFNLDPEKIEALITPRTKAIIPVHLFGQSADMDAIMDIAERNKLAVIEDAAQSMGAKYKGRQVGSFGDFGVFSFFPSKNLGGMGDAGMLISNEDALVEHARLLRTHGAQPKYYHKYVGGNFRIDALHAALLRVKLPHCAQYNARRASNAAYYTAELSKVPGVEIGGHTASTDARLILPSAVREAASDNHHIWNQYTLRVGSEGQRDALHRFLREGKIGSEIYYPVPLHQQECFADVRPAEPLPVAEQLARKVLSIPVYPELSRSQQDEVISAISAFLATH